MMGCGLILSLGSQTTGGAAAPALAAPYNRTFIVAPGDSRTAMGSGLGGTYGVSLGVNFQTYATTGTGVDGILAALCNNRIKRGPQKNPGIGGQTAVMVANYPRQAQNLGSSGNITGTILTITAKAGGDPFTVGQLITGTGVTANTTILSQVSGVAGGAGTYNVSQSSTTGSITDIIGNYLYGSAEQKTIADVAANPGAIVLMWVGTNDTVPANVVPAIEKMIKGLTDPAYTYPGYGAPLPLYNGLPKTVILLNETRKGITALNAVANQLTPVVAAQFKAMADTLKRYSFDSGNATYANPRVLVVDTFDDSRIADLADTSTYNPKPGYWADGLHQATTVSAMLAKIVSERINANIDASVDYSRVPTVSSPPSYSQNGLFQTQTGGTQSLGSHTLNGTIPQGWKLQVGTASSGLTLDSSFNALGGDLGSEWVVRVTGTPNSAGTLLLQCIPSAGQLSSINLATDRFRATARTKLLLTAGDVNSATMELYGYKTALANGLTSGVGLFGVAAGYTNNASYPMLLRNPSANAEWTEWRTDVTPDWDLGQYGATGAPSVLQLNINIGFKATAALDITIRVSQAGIAKVTD